MLFPIEHILIDDNDTNVSIVDFACALKRTNVQCPNFDHTFLDATGLKPHGIVNKDSKSNDPGKWLFSSYERTKLPRLQRKRKAGYGSIQITNINNGAREVFTGML